MKLVIVKEDVESVSLGKLQLVPDDLLELLEGEVAWDQVSIES
jgi:hypothetical protein